MSTLTPPVQLEHPENQFRVDYMQDVASQHNFEYTTVSHISDNSYFPVSINIFLTINCLHFRSSMNTRKYCGKIEVFSLVLKDPMNINSLTVQNSKCYINY